jgi:tetratricopeptide (TPR) repeat protein
MDLTFQGLACRNKGHNPVDLAQARRFFERALALDQRNLDALLGAAEVDLNVATGYMADDPARVLAAVEATLIKALALAPNNAWAHWMMGRVYVGTNRMAQGIAEHERALALDPNSAAAHASIGYAKVVNGHAEETEAHVLEALRPSPSCFLALTRKLSPGTAERSKSTPIISSRTSISRPLSRSSVVSMKRGPQPEPDLRSIRNSRSAVSAPAPPPTIQSS